MSRIGKKPIIIPAGVEVKIEKGQIIVKGPKGELKRDIPAQIKIEIKEASSEAAGDKELIVGLAKRTKKSPALWGLFRVLISNMVEGVTNGFEKKLEIKGVGYRASVKDNKLILSIGYSHPVEIEPPAGIELKTEKEIIIVSGIDKQLVGQVAAKIREQKKPEPYKGKGIRYLGEIVRRKAGKKAVGTE